MVLVSLCPSSSLLQPSRRSFVSIVLFSGALNHLVSFLASQFFLQTIRVVFGSLALRLECRSHS